MEDWENDMADSDFSVGLSSKLNNLLIGVQDHIDAELMSFTVEELATLKKLYGSSLTYALHKDIEHAMSLPKATESVH